MTRFLFAVAILFFSATTFADFAPLPPAPTIMCSDGYRRSVCNQQQYRPQVQQQQVQVQTRASCPQGRPVFDRQGRLVACELPPRTQQFRQQQRPQHRQHYRDRDRDRGDEITITFSRRR